MDQPSYSTTDSTTISYKYIYISYKNVLLSTDVFYILILMRNVRLIDKQYNISDILVHVYILLITLNYVVLKETSISFP